MTGELPEGWTYCRADEICGSVRDGTHDTPRYVEDGVPLVTSKHLQGGTIDLSTTKKISQEDHAEISKRSAVDIGDVLFAMIGTIGNAVLVTHPPHYSIKNLALFKGNPGYLESSYMHRWLSSSTYLSRLSPQLKGTSQKFASLGLLRESQVPLPPLNEQRRIVAKIDALTEKSREAREALDEVPALLDQLRQSILAAAFRGDLTKKWREQNPNVEPASLLLDRIRQERRKKWEEAELAKFQAKGKVPKGDDWKSKYKEPEPVDTEGLPELPEGWSWANFELIAPLLSGFAFKSSDYKSEGTFLVRIGEILPEGVKKRDGSRYLPRSYLGEHQRFRIEQGDLLIAMSGATTGKYGTYLLEEPALLNQRVGKFDIVNRCLTRPDYVRGLVASHQDAILGAAWGGGQPNISPKAIDALPIALAPQDEQDAIVRTLTTGFAAMFSTDELSISLDQQLMQLDSSILAKAFRGELVPQDPDDEPASVLLERIRQEREGAASPKKAREKKKS